MRVSIQRARLGVSALALTLALAACGQATPAVPPTAAPEANQAPTALAATTAPESATIMPEAGATTTATGLQYVEVLAGTGEAPKAGDIVSVHYRGTLADGTEFDSSYSRNEPISFALGTGQVIPGWDEGIALMRKGGKARLIIPPNLAYGSRGAGGVIPPNATLTFEVELVDIREGSPASPTTIDESAFTTTPSGLKYSDMVVGDGATAEAGKTVEVHYTGWLQDGTKFDSSLDRGQTFSVQLGAGQVIPGWDEGLQGMKVGGKRQLVIPPDLGYGASGAGGVIPPNATLVFEVELVSVQ